MTATRPGDQPGLAQTASLNGGSTRIPETVRDAITGACRDRAGQTLPNGEVRFRCPCPDHPDEHPSARWSPEKGTWFCDVCKEGGGWMQLADLLGINRQVPEPIPFVPRPQRQSEPKPSVTPTASRFDAHGEWHRMFLYTDEHDDPIVTVHRIDYADGRPKKVWQEFETPDRKKPAGFPNAPLHLSQLLAAPAGSTVYIAEGEPQVLLLESWELTATTNLGGAGKWSGDFGRYFAGQHVIILPDNDEPGGKHGDQVRDSVRPYAASVRTIRLSDEPKGDVIDWAAGRQRRDDLLALVVATPPEPLDDRSPVTSDSEAV